ncbi:MAG: efflux RND transporter periplasmic adaptor subunit [Alphaproteobacteria bacterium]|nr:efflux RND transporter periplasmic adaptor subunit [Alphaproteobacteria bacterium]
MKSLLPAIVIVAGYFGYDYLVATKPEPPVRPKQERAFTIQSATVKAATYQPQLTLFGSIVAGRQVDIRALVSGQIIETGETLREGGQVGEGDLLLKIDPIDYSTGLAELRAQLAETQAKVSEFESSLATVKQSLKYSREQLKIAKADLDRAKPLARRRAITERTVDDRRQAMLQRQLAADELENNLKVWEARIRQQQAAALRLENTIERAERRLAETVLTAPFSAYVTEVGAQVGRMVGSNDKVATLIDRNWIEARFNLTDRQFGRIVAKEGTLAGREITVQWKLGQTTFTYPAIVERIAARISSATGGVEVYARVKNPNKPIPLRPGAFVEIKVPDTTFENVFRVPATALYNGTTVFAVKDGRLQPRAVTLAAGIDEDLLVRGELSDGDRILVSRISTPGAGIKVQEAEVK